MIDRAGRVFCYDSVGRILYFSRNEMSFFLLEEEGFIANRARSIDLRKSCWRKSAECGGRNVAWFGEAQSGEGAATAGVGLRRLLRRRQREKR